MASTRAGARIVISRAAAGRTTRATLPASTSTRATASPSRIDHRARGAGGGGRAWRRRPGMLGGTIGSSNTGPPRASRAAASAAAWSSRPRAAGRAMRHGPLRPPSRARLIWASRAARWCGSSKRCARSSAERLRRSARSGMATVTAVMEAGPGPDPAAKARRSPRRDRRRPEVLVALDAQHHEAFAGPPWRERGGHPGRDDGGRPRRAEGRRQRPQRTIQVALVRQAAVRHGRAEPGDGRLDVATEDGVGMARVRREVGDALARVCRRAARPPRPAARRPTRGWRCRPPRRRRGRPPRPAERPSPARPGRCRRRPRQWTASAASGSVAATDERGRPSTPR